MVEGGETGGGAFQVGSVGVATVGVVAGLAREVGLVLAFVKVHFVGA